MKMIMRRNHFAIVQCPNRIYRPSFRENKPKRSFSMIDSERFGLVFAKTWFYKFGHRILHFCELSWHGRKFLLEPRRNSNIWFGKVEGKEARIITWWQLLTVLLVFFNYTLLSTGTGVRGQWPQKYSVGGGVRESYELCMEFFRFLLLSIPKLRI
jgi:hypothetical protein